VARVERFHEHNGMVMIGAAQRYSIPERLGLLVAVPTVGNTILDGPVLIVASDLLRRDPPAFVELVEWGARQPVRTPLGWRHVIVVTSDAFMDPDLGLFARAYMGAWWVITADEGRSLGLLADYWAPARDAFWRGGFTLGLAGWGEVAEWTDRHGRTRRGWRPLLHRPVVRIKAVGPHAVIARFGKAGKGGLTPDGKPAGRWERGLPYRGHRIVDLIGPAHGFDGYDTGDLAEHLAAFGLPALNVPAAVTVDPSGAEQLLAIALAIHKLAVALDEEAALWLTTPEDQRDGRAYLGFTT
jgi:hypothetical protein